MENDLNISDKDKFMVTSPIANMGGAIIFLILMVIGIFTNDFWAGLIFGIFISAAFRWIVNFLYIFTPFFHRKQERIDKIYEYFKQSFHTIINFDEQKHEKIDEFSQDKKLNSAKITDDEIMYNIYMKAYKAKADAIILNSINNDELRCTLVKYKK
ncbi:hypothetical protein CRV08_01985 [Halarcobacter ebronensis]|uniref:Uncharacterized protein n=1 Tax=Halarcobacter ebronensis TaxID=1462615 RepID=A0A4Q0YGX2_9BACT|nr:hypothetical protein [Halarcobacter ebronensis]RXJ69495.1 hypothetical protein CRV08_01985 [Halarcobacter ebronensis]